MLLSIPLAAPAAVISWGTAADIASASDVVTDGMLVEALNAGANGVASRTVNGVLFTGTGTLLNQSNALDSFPADSTGDAEYNGLLSTI
ncbi:hypothetical protein, partial [Pontiella sp.]|uniref:hypothetical protein n=1 Tax=Pontiella sp. TaxID=2837462 RepID=UPI00356147C3